jgi:hypothetical protein
MLTRNGKIVFSLLTIVIVVTLSALFLKSTPNLAVTPFPEKTPESTAVFTPTSDILKRLSGEISTFGVDADTISGAVYFSPDNRHALFQAEPKPVEGQLEPGSRVILVNFETGTMKKIYDGLLTGAPSWAGSTMAFSSDGVYMYNLKAETLNVVSQSGSNPIVSPDERFVAFKNDGIDIFSIESGSTTSLTDDKDDIPATWIESTSKILIFKSDGTNLGEGAGMRQYVGVLDSVTKEIQEITSVPRGKFYRAISLGGTYLITGGFDDGRSDFIANLNTDKTTIVHQNVALSEVFVDVVNNQVSVYNNVEVKVYNSSGEIVHTVTLKDVPVPPNTPRWFKANDEYIWISYVTGDPLRVRIIKWNKSTGDIIEDIPTTDGSVAFFSATSLYALLTESHTRLLFNQLK